MQSFICWVYQIRSGSSYGYDCRQDAGTMRGHVRATFCVREHNSLAGKSSVLRVFLFFLWLSLLFQCALGVRSLVKARERVQCYHSFLRTCTSQLCCIRVFQIALCRTIKLHQSIIVPIKKFKITCGLSTCKSKLIFPGL